MNSAYNFGVIRALRKRARMTLKQLAEASGLTYPTVEMIETNKTTPSLRTLDAVAGALRIPVSNLICLAERRLVQRRRAEDVEGASEHPGLRDVDMVKMAVYDDAKIFHLHMRPGQCCHVMDLHQDCHEFCYVLQGVVELRLAEKRYRLKRYDSLLFDALQDHAYTALEETEFMTVHMPKDTRILEALLAGRTTGEPAGAGVPA